MAIRFESAWESSIRLVQSELRSSLKDGGKIVLVRDLFGRVHLAIERAISPEALTQIKQGFASSAGPFWSGSILIGEEMIAPDVVFASQDLFEVERGLWLLERTVTGAEWGRGALANQGRKPPRATLYGLKGGVGRSTALSAWAWHLARLGKKVLAIDLDLESPGISSLLLPPDHAPDFGVVDWFVEDAVGNADDELVEQLLARSPLANDTPGEIHVAPCGGSGGNDYLAKLSRAYFDVPRDGRVDSFAERVAALVDRLEEYAAPDVVLIDSRAGLHDLAAIATTRLDAMTFLFARGGRSTWDGYRTLLSGWARHPAVARDVRERIRVVAAQVPDHGRQDYIERLNQEAYDAFADTLYEVSGPDGDLEAFNFDMKSIDAPHYPLRVNWHNALTEWDPHQTQVSYDEVRGALGDFLDQATELTLGHPSERAGDSELHGDVDLG
jgi:hypothetical protein